MSDLRTFTAAAILAAGAGHRFVGPGHKLTSGLPGGESILQRSVAVALAAGIGEVIVVLGALSEADARLPATVAVVEHPGWADGQASSLQVACRWAEARGHQALVVALADQPGLTPTAWQRVAAASGTPVAVATYGGQRGHPVRLERAIWPLLPTAGDGGARALLRDQPKLVTEVACDGDPTDIDTVDDLAHWLAAPHPASDRATWPDSPAGETGREVL